MKKPIIGVAPLFDTEKDSYWMLPGYMQGIADAGGLPVILPLTDNAEDLAQLCDSVDGFLFTGGQDVSPSVYGEKKKSTCGETLAARDNTEKILLALAQEKDKPILGICRGIQFINAALGGTLYQDLPTEYGAEVNHCQSPPYDVPVHSVSIIEGSELYKLLNVKNLRVNSYHHQAVKTLAPPLEAMAYSEDGLVEAVRLTGSKFIWAIQWHPEFSFKTDESSRKIFKAFINAAEE